jgi:6-phosphogluconolactonase/glucosamine-6-phosphate isomerase/deaminase
MTLTIPALLAAKRVLAIVRSARRGGYRALRGPISTDCPSSILRQAPPHLFLDTDSAQNLPAQRTRYRKAP